jgi:hypothetical protein
MIMLALANEIQSERQKQRKPVELRSSASSNSPHGSTSVRPATGLVRRLIATIGLRPGLT